MMDFPKDTLSVFKWYAVLKMRSWSGEIITWIIVFDAASVARECRYLQGEKKKNSPL